MKAQEWDERYSGTELLWGAGPNVFVESELSGLVPGATGSPRALDLACGEGRNAIWLAAQGWQVTGVDFSRAGLARAEQLAGRQGVSARWVAADLNEYQPERGAYGLVLLCYLHLRKPELTRVLAAAATALAPGGIALVIAHDLENLERGTGGPQDPAVLYGPQDVVAALPGLRVKTAERRERVTAAGVAIDTVVMAERPAVEGEGDG